MNVLFCYKWERDSNEATITSEGALKWFDTKLKATDDEATAIVMAKKIAEETGGELTGVTIGDGDVYWALARGAGRAVSADALTPSADNAATAARLASTIKAAGEYDLIIMGDSQEYSGVVPATAAKLGINMIVGAQDVRPDGESANTVLVTRATAHSQETLRVHTPALISIAAVGTEKTRPTMRQVMAAKKMPVERIEVTAEGEEKLNITGTRLPEKRRAVMFESAEELVNALRERELI